MIDDARSIPPRRSLGSIWIVFLIILFSGQFSVFLDGFSGSGTGTGKRGAYNGVYGDALDDRLIILGLRLRQRTGCIWRSIASERAIQNTAVRVHHGFQSSYRIFTMLLLYHYSFHTVAFSNLIYPERHPRPPSSLPRLPTFRSLVILESLMRRELTYLYGFSSTRDA